MTTRMIRATEQAKMIRAALKGSFPGFRFDSVRSERGGSIRICWTNGPSKADVDGIVQKFRGGDFDGMQDMRIHHDTKLPCGEVVSFMADFVFVERTITEALIDKARQALNSLPPEEATTLMNKAPFPYENDMGKRVAHLISLNPPQAIDLPTVLAK